jgi:hypothetical protein
VEQKQQVMDTTLNSVPVALNRKVAGVTESVPQRQEDIAAGVEQKQQEMDTKLNSVTESLNRKVACVTESLPQRQEDMMEDALGTVRKRMFELSSVYETGMSSMEGRLQALECKSEASAMKTEATAEEMRVSVRSVEEKLEAVQSEQGQINEVLRAVSDQYQHFMAVGPGTSDFHAMETQLRAEGAELSHSVGAQLQVVQADQGQLKQALRTIEEQHQLQHQHFHQALRGLEEQQQLLQAAQQQQQRQQQLAQSNAALCPSEKPAGLAASVRLVEGQLLAMQSEQGQVKEEIQAMKAMSEQHHQLVVTCAGLPRVQSVEEQLRATKSETSQVKELLSNIEEQQQQFHVMHQRQEQDLQNILATVKEQSGSRATSTEDGSTELKEMRSEVAMLANAINMLCGRVDELSSADHNAAMQAEIGAIAKVVSKLSERVDRLEPKDPLIVSTGSPLRPTRPSGRPWADPIPEVGGVGEADAGDTASALRQQLAALVGGDVHPAHRKSGASDHQSCQSDDGRESVREEVAHLGVGARYTERPLATQFAQPGALLQPAAILGRKAPSPRKWLTEPLSVSVARSDTPTSRGVTPNTSIGHQSPRLTSPPRQRYSVSSNSPGFGGTPDAKGRH